MRSYGLLLLCLLLLAGCSESDAGLIVRGSTSAGATDYTADANCMGAWFMNSGDSETDRSGESGTLGESPSDDIPTSATVPSGYSGTSRDFEGGDGDGLLHADNLSTDINGANQSMSMCCWFKFEAAPDSDDTLIAKYYVIDDERQYKMQFRNTDSAMCAYISSDGTSGTTTKAIGATDITDTNWHHCCVVYNDTDIRIYLDGSLDSNGASNPISHTAGIYAGTAQFGVGNLADTLGEAFDGLMDEVIVFNRALSSSEVSDIMTNGIDGTKGGND